MRLGETNYQESEIFKGVEQQYETKDKKNECQGEDFIIYQRTYLNYLYRIRRCHFSTN